MGGRHVGDLFAPVAAAAGGPRQSLVLTRPWPALPAWMHERTYLTGEFLMQARMGLLLACPVVVYWLSARRLNGSGNGPG